MRQDIAARNDESYRRGVVLGLTIAEVTILLLFCLLLTAVLLLNEKQQSLDKLEQAMLTPTYVVSPEVVAAVEARVGPGRSQSEINEFFQKLIADDDLKQMVQTLLQESDIEQSDPDDFSALREIPALIEAARKIVAVLGLPSSNPRDLTDGLSTIQDDVARLASDRALRENADESAMAVMARSLCALQYDDPRQLAECESKVVEIIGGKGLEFQSCWWDKTTVPWKTKSLYDVALTDDGYVLRDLDPGVPEYRAQKESELGLVDIPMETTIVPDDFMSLTQGVYEWSVAHECRFYVRVFDETAPTSKETYKTRLATLETHFYKLPTSRRFFDGAPTVPR